MFEKVFYEEVPNDVHVIGSRWNGRAQIPYRDGLFNKKGEGFRIAVNL